MSRVSFLREMLAYGDWAWGRLADRAFALSDAQLDAPFEMGEGSLRKTIRHIYGAARNWMVRIGGTADAPRSGREDVPGLPFAAELTGIDEMGASWRAVSDRYRALLGESGDQGLDRVISFQSLDGKPYRTPLFEILLHVFNHAQHHRAQALNMLRRLGAEPILPGLDYIFFRNEMLLDNRPPPELDVASLRAYTRYCDWAAGTLHTVARGLSDAQLDQPFEIGCGTLRATLLHIRFAEQWWLENWTLGPDKPFPELDQTTSIATLEALYRQTASARDAILASMTAEGLVREVVGRPRPGVERRFPIGVTMLQLCGHGVHHRAQALNMLRHVGAAVPGLDYITYWRETNGS